MKPFELSEKASASITRRFPKILFDESHQQAWSIDLTKASLMNPAQPKDSCYSLAARRLQKEGFRVERQIEGHFDQKALLGVSVVVLPHFSEPSFELTTGNGVHRLTTSEIEALVMYVKNGGGLVVLAEHEHDKYGNNLNNLLDNFGLKVTHTAVVDPGKNHNNVAAWVRPNIYKEIKSIATKVEDIILYRAGIIASARDMVKGEEFPDGFAVIARSSETAQPANAPMIVATKYGAGRVIVVADSDIFGDDSVTDADNLQLFANIVTWASAGESTASTVVKTDLPESWNELKDAASELRKLQTTDGSIDLKVNDIDKVNEIARRTRAAYAEMVDLFPHDKDFHIAVLEDYDNWIKKGYLVPDFVESLKLFRPDLQRVDGLEHLILLPMYTQNGNESRVFEAIWIRTVWPEWISELESGGFSNPAFVPVEFIDFTEGYNTHSAVFFPETVATSYTPKFHWGGIFSDREAVRFIAVTKAASEILSIDLPADVELMLNDPKITQETYVLWDLVHDRQHSLGELPFDPFMIKQRSPYWMYSLEELRCDLAAYLEMDALSEKGIPHARLVKYAVLFDRILRFPISGGRIRNYDGLVGQIIFAHLHRNAVIRWADNTLSVDWDQLDGAIAELSEKVNSLYRDGIDHSKISFWLQARALVRTLVPPHPGSRWEAGLDYTLSNKELLDAILPDEFPLNVFYEALSKKLAPAIESTKGATL